MTHLICNGLDITLYLTSKISPMESSNWHGMSCTALEKFEEMPPKVSTWPCACSYVYLQQLNDIGVLVEHFLQLVKDDVVAVWAAWVGPHSAKGQVKALTVGIPLNGDGAAFCGTVAQNQFAKVVQPNFRKQAQVRWQIWEITMRRWYSPLNSIGLWTIQCSNTGF